MLLETALTKTKPVVIYSDGGSDPNPGIGGWAAVLRSGYREKVLTGNDPATTNNRMELTAAIHALEALKIQSVVDFHTDSEYVRKGITEWIEGWAERGWKTKSGKPVSNADLWQRLWPLVQRHTIEWHWVKGHSGDPHAVGRRIALEQVLDPDLTRDPAQRPGSEAEILRLQRQLRVDAQADQFRLAPPVHLPLFPLHATQSMTNPAVEIAQHRPGLAEAEIPSPADQVGLQPTHPLLEPRQGLGCDPRTDTTFPGRPEGKTQKRPLLFRERLR